VEVVKVHGRVEAYRWLAGLLAIMVPVALAACAGVTTPGAVSGNNPTNRAEVPRMAVEELYELTSDNGDDILVVDVRSLSDYEEGHIAGAIPVPLLEILTGEWSPPEDREAVLYCS
jgi:hypothetical protein